jgi:hypothetical protein
LQPGDFLAFYAVYGFKHHLAAVFGWYNTADRQNIIPDFLK